MEMDLDANGRILRIAIHPTNANILYVAALGHAMDPSPSAASIGR